MRFIWPLLLMFAACQPFLSTGYSVASTPNDNSRAQDDSWVQAGHLGWRADIRAGIVFVWLYPGLNGPTQAQVNSAEVEIRKRCGKSAFIVDEETMGSAKYYWRFHCGPLPPEREPWDGQPKPPEEI